jgi:poly(3-hydroxybutyrate) depolymerase
MRLVLTLLALLQFSALAHGQDVDVAKLYEAKQNSSTAPDGQTLTLPYRLLKPKTIEPNKRYPLLLFLHGGGERGSDHQQQLKHFPTWLASDENREKYPCFVVVPQIPAEMGLAAPPLHDPTPHPLGEMTRPMRGVVSILDAPS